MNGMRVMTLKKKDILITLMVIFSFFKFFSFILILIILIFISELPPPQTFVFSATLDSKLKEDLKRKKSYKRNKDSAGTMSKYLFITVSF